MAMSTETVAEYPALAIGRGRRHIASGPAARRSMFGKGR